MSYLTPQNSYALTANSNDAVGGINGSDTNITYSTVAGNLSAGFNGTTSKIVMSAPTITGSGDMTLVGWVYSGTVTDVKQYMVSNRKASDDNLGIYNFRIETNGKLNFWDFGGGAFGYSTTAYSNTALSANTWYHVAFVKSGVNGTYYLNGSSDGTTTAAGNKSYSSDASHPMTLGWQADNAYFFGGNLVAWQVYAEALSGSDISALYNGGVVLQYPFSTGLSASVSDTSNVTESVSMTEVDLISKSDTTAITESVALSVQDFVNKSDTTAITESAVLSVQSFPSVSDTSAMSEAVTVTVSAPQVSVSDTTAMSEALTMSGTEYVNKSDTTPVTEAVTMAGTVYISVSDTSNVTDTPATALTDLVFVPKQQLVPQLVLIG